MKLSNEQCLEYIECGGSRCPHCGSDNIEGVGSIEIDGPMAWQKIVCLELECGAAWHDIYVLASVEDLP